MPLHSDSNEVSLPGSELVVVMKAGAVQNNFLANAPADFEVGIERVKSVLLKEGAELEPLFGFAENKMELAVMALPATVDLVPANFSNFYLVKAPESSYQIIAQRLRVDPLVDVVYIKPPAEPPTLLMDHAPSLNAPAPAITPDYSSRQGYLDAAPEGIDARYAWTQDGGNGLGVNIIDVEGEWRFTHEDLLSNQGGLVGGISPNNLGWRNHGTAVIGEFGSDKNGFGTTGICPDANVRAVSIFPNQGSSRAIAQAANFLNAGDILLVELHRPGPRNNFQSRGDQAGFIAVEWWPDDYQAIRFATGKGIIVVEAAGNGAEDLDDLIYDQNPTSPNGPFPTWWQNPFRRNSLDSGAILVGAGSPPPGTHGRNHGPDRSRLGFSNYGKSLDAQGWGREVTTTGYGDLQGGQSEDYWYTDTFSGTSSASPIVVGALGCLQGILKAAGKPLLSPAQARQYLRTTGSVQQDAPGRPKSQRIGNRPDLRQLINSLVP